jgi:hypothetical protein
MANSSQLNLLKGEAMTPSIRPRCQFPLSPIFLTGFLFAVVGVLFIMALSVSPYSFRSSTKTVHIYCASVAVDPMQRVVDRFNQSDTAKSNLVRAEITRAGGTSELAGQISAENSMSINAGCDAFVSADQTRIQPLVENVQFCCNSRLSAKFDAYSLGNRIQSDSDWSDDSTVCKKSRPT